jgi:hypothetical protein
MKDEKMRISKEHVHQFVFQDIEDCGDEIRKVYACRCGVKLVDTYIRIATDWETGKGGRC